MLILAWLVLLGLLATYFIGMEEQQYNPNQQPEYLEEGERKKLLLKANKNNHFVMTGKINGRDVTLLLDTGATNVAIPARLASKLDLEPGREGIAMTANGPVKVYGTLINRLQLGNIILENIPADLNPSMNDMNEILLGMSALSRINFSQRNGTLILEQ